MEYPKWRRRTNLTMNFMLSQRIFLLLQAKSHANSLAGTYPLGIREVNQVNKKIRKKHFSRLFLLPTDPIFQAKMTGNENIIDDCLTIDSPLPSPCTFFNDHKNMKSITAFVNFFYVFRQPFKF